MTKSQGITTFVCALLLPAWVAAAGVKLNPDHPQRYTVVKGDTLWDISARFLNDPWLWPKVWQANRQIKNPHLIYPGDVVVLTVEDGKPALRVLRRQTVKLSPAIRTESLDEAIATLPPELIRPFLTQPRIIDRKDLPDAGYVVIGLDDKLLLGKYSEFYARGVNAQRDANFYIFRPGRQLIHPDTGEQLGYMLLYIGAARVLKAGDPTKLLVTDSEQEIVPRDRLLPAPQYTPIPRYLPRPPDKKVRGRILAILRGVREAGVGSVVAVSLGARDGAEPGHALRILRNAGARRDPVTGKSFSLPEERSGVVMIFRVFKKVSYALIMNATDPAHVGDAIETP